jgi:hypothetical protein
VQRRMIWSRRRESTAAISLRELNARRRITCPAFSNPYNVRHEGTTHDHEPKPLHEPADRDFPSVEL